MKVTSKFRSLLKRLLSDFPDREQIAQLNQEISNTQVSQRILFLHYQQLRNLKCPLPKLEDTGFRVYSQNDEDGLLLYIFSLIGAVNKACVEIGFGSPYGANTTNLICNWGWTGLLVEGNERIVEQSRRFFESHKDTWVYPPKLVHAWVTAENVNGLIQENDITGEIDLFSLDIDGMDYWVWKSLGVIQPRVVVVEYQDIWGPEKSVTVPYKPDFVHPEGSFDYCGASLPAFVKLGREKGYRLVGCNRYGFNAFFVRNGIGEDALPEIKPDHCFKHPKAKEGQQARLPKAMKYEWVEV